MMDLLRRLRVSLKTLLELGPAGPALYLLYRLGLLTGHYRRLEPGIKRDAQFLRGSFHPAFSLPEPEELARTVSGAARAALIREANAIIRGRIKRFGGNPVALQLAFREPLQHWTAYETQEARLPIPHSGSPQSADLKFIWEPARFGWAFTLGRAFHLSRKEEYAQSFWKYFERFSKGNPPYLGPHWMNGQEVAIRLLALIWSAQVFASAVSSTPSRRARLVQAIALHAARIPPTLVYARAQANNHLVSESTALYMAGAVLNHQPWVRLGWRWLNYALQHQTSPYGEYIQQSTNYHRLMLEAALWADAVRRGRHEIWPAATSQALARASHWLFSMLDPVSGRTPNLGANDGSLILPLSSTAFDDYRPTVQAAARAFLRTGLPAGPWDEFSVWLGLRARKHTADSKAYAADHVRGRNSWGYLRASAFKSRLSHMDQLHFDLWWRGRNVAQDAGTYLYTAAPPWDNPLVSTRVHNTVTVDGHDQMTRAGRFLTLDWFPAYSEQTMVGEHQVLAHHAGYGRLGIRHERRAGVSHDEEWVIKDDLIFTRHAEHTLRLHWLLLDGEWQIRQRKSEVLLRLRLPGGWMKVIISGTAFADLSLQVMLVRAGHVLHGRGPAQPYDGWVSPTYGVKVPALSLAVEARSKKSLSFITRIAFSKAAGRKL